MDLLTDAVTAFNNRRYDEAVALTAVGLRDAVGQEELFWMGLHETSQAFSHIAGNRLPQAEEKIISAMEKLRNFGYRHNNLEVTSVLAGLRRGLEEVRHVRAGRRNRFDATLLPQIKLAARADSR